MAFRVVKYQDAFEGILGLKYDDKLKAFTSRLEKEGHTEKSICFTIWKKQDKLNIFRRDSRFLAVLENEINKWSWKKDDPRWKEYWKRKEEEKKAERIRKELTNQRKDENALRPSKHSKGFVYFIQGQCGGAIKIGFSMSPKNRLRELQTGYPDTLILLAMIPGNEAKEAAIHRELEAFRLKGEWFRPDEYVINKIKELSN